MNEIHLGQEFLKELEAEAAASRKCVERIPPALYKYKPHEKSMEMGYLAVLVAEIPKWIAIMINDNEINFATWQRYNMTSTEDMVKYFDKNMEDARDALKNVANEQLQTLFYLKAGDKELMSSTRQVSVSSALNHWVHHRGQLTVYMRLNNIAVPAIYGPSADDNQWQ